MSTPKRIRRERTRGWRMPENAVYVGRPTKWGNPFRGESGAATGTRQMLVDDYQRWVLTPCWTDPRNGKLRSRGGSCDSLMGVPFSARPSIADIRRELAGRDLACWCFLDQPCHADVLLRIAAGGE